MAETSVQTRIMTSNPITVQNKQNYAPFISKSPRFEQKQTHSQKEKSSTRQLAMAETIEHQLPSNVRQSGTQSNSPQSIFKSKVGRFEESPQPTPSPGQYSIANPPNTLKKAVINSAKHSPVLPLLKTIPTIPDHRNKYGYINEGDMIKVVEKSR